MIPAVEVFNIISETKDRFGTISDSSVVHTFYGISDEETVYHQKGESLNILGQGRVYTSDNSYEFSEGETIEISGVEYIIRKIFKAKVMGEFHHWELTYA